MYYSRICLEGLSETTKFTVGIGGVPAEICAVELHNNGDVI
jgi:hypothetical protein